MADMGLSAALLLAGTAVSAVGTIAAGQARQRQANFEAAQYEANAKEERAAGQQEGFEIARQKRLALSRNQAVASASGFSSTDASSLDLIGEIESYGSWQEQIANYGGRARANTLEAQAKGTRMSGKAAATAAFIDAGSTILGGASTFFQKYGGGKPFQPAASYRYG